MTLEEPIEQVAEILEEFLSSAEIDDQFLEKPYNFGPPSDVSKLAPALQNIKLEALLEPDTELYKVLEVQAAEFVTLSGLTKVVDKLILEIQGSEEQVEQGQLPEEHVLTICKLSLLLEWQVQSIRDETYPSSKSDFFTLLQLILESLFGISTSHISCFWDFLELRIQLFKDYVFDKNVTLHRIALLGLCNGLADKYYIRNSLGKLDSYAKDTFNDEFQARVRMFLANMLSFEDLTGLNKYFAISNRENKEPALTRTKSSDDDLLQDVLTFYRLLRNPFAYFKTPRQLHSIADSLDKLAGYLLEQEAKYARKHPGRDIFTVQPPQLEAQIAEVTEKLKRIVFFPENYWLSLFDAKRDEKVKLDDQATMLKQLDSSAFRRLLIIHIYLVSSFFVDLLASNKAQLIKSIGTNVKHVSDATTPESLMKFFTKIKREIARQSRSWDTQLSFLLLNLSQSEEHWWSWLLYGKDKDGNPVLTDRNLDKEELTSTQEKLNSAVGFKTRKYFNTYATPQLSRKMKTQTGLHLLERHDDESTNYEDLIAELTTKIEEAREAEDADREKELLEERTVLLWKRLKEARLNQWLQLGDLLNAEDLEVSKKKEEEPEEKKEEQEQVEKKEEDETMEKEETEPETVAKPEENEENGPTESKKRARSPEEEEEDDTYKKQKTDPDA